MTDFQKELILELREYVLDYVRLASNLGDLLVNIVDDLDNEDIDQFYSTPNVYKQMRIQAAANYRQSYLELKDVFQTLRNERETWKALITSFEEQES